MKVLSLVCSGLGLVNRFWFWNWMLLKVNHLSLQQLLLTCMMNMCIPFVQQKYKGMQEEVEHLEQGDFGGGTSWSATTASWCSCHCIEVGGCRQATWTCTHSHCSQGLLERIHGEIIAIQFPYSMDRKFASHPRNIGNQTIPVAWAWHSPRFHALSLGEGMLWFWRCLECFNGERGTVLLAAGQNSERASWCKSELADALVS